MSKAELKIKNNTEIDNIMTFEVKNGQTLLEAMRNNNIAFEAPCGGKGICGKCAVKIVAGNDKLLLPEELKYFSEEQIETGYRLACLYHPASDICIQLNTNNNDSFAFLKEQLERYESISPYFRKVYSEPDEMTFCYYGETYLGSECGDTTKDLYGVAVDLGTTTVVASLVNLNNGNVLSQSSRINPQKDYGLDVLSRIEYQNRHEVGLSILNQVIRNCINEMVMELCNNTSTDASKIYDMTIAGNTTMLHLFLGISATTLGKAPYKSLIEGSVIRSMESLELKGAAFGQVYILPPVSGFIGSDITGGAMVSSLDKQTKTTLFIDIGTNGELVLKIKDKLLTCSCAAGPAFEGMNIFCGMRASKGAIEKIRILENGELYAEVIGGKQAQGICGSGIVDIMSELIRHRILGKTGRIAEASALPKMLQSWVCEDDNGRYIKFAVNGCSFKLYQSDLRQIQLAKGAILSGIYALTELGGISPEDLDAVFIAGQFGKHLSIESLIGIGIIPSCLNGKISYIGNTARKGAECCLIHKQWRKEVEDIALKMTYLELSQVADYERMFAKCLNLY